MKKLIEHKCYQSTNTLLLSFLTIMINNFERKIYFDTFCKCAQLEVSVSFDIMTAMPACHLSPLDSHSNIFKHLQKYK